MQASARGATGRLSGPRESSRADHRFARPAGSLAEAYSEIRRSGGRRTVSESSQQITAYIRELFLPHDAVLEADLRRAHEAGLRSIQVPPEVGRLLGDQLLARHALGIPGRGGVR